MEFLASLLAPDFFAAVFRAFVPVCFAALGGLITRRAGILNMALEAMMLWSALLGVIFSGYSKVWFPDLPDVACLLIGMVAGILACLLVSGILAFFSLKLKANNILVGIALNNMADGGSCYLMFLLLETQANTESLTSFQFPAVNIPLIQDIPVIGPILSGHNLMFYLAVLAVILVYIFIFKTPTGLRIRAVGENPDAAESVGIKVLNIKTMAVLLSGFVTAFGGMYFSMGYMNFFSRNMTAGRGFIALAAMNLSNANPIGTFFASMLFGFCDGIGTRLSTLGAFSTDLIKAIPYAVTMLALILYAVIRARKINKIKSAR